jgi:LemA protein
MSSDPYLFLGLGLILLVLLTGLGLYNRLVRARERTREAWSGIDVQLRRRANLIPNLVDTVKGYAGHERATFEEVTRARSGLVEAAGAADTAEANGRLNRALERLLALAEAYPKLKASAHFLALQADLFDTEEKIAYARQFYNRNVATLNTRIRTIPHALVARIFGFEPFEFFATEEGEGEALRISLEPGPEPPIREPT